MSALLKVQPLPAAARIAHSVLAYDHATEALDLELPVPLFLDTLALKVAGIPAEDEYGAGAYPLDMKALEVFRFLLGLEVDVLGRAYFLEPTVGQTAGFTPVKLKAIELLSEVTPAPRYDRTEQAGVSERELVLPVLRLLDRGDGGWISAEALVEGLAAHFGPFKRDAEDGDGRAEHYFSRKLWNMIAHRDDPSSFIRRGLADYQRRSLRISEEGRATAGALLS